MKLLMLKVLFAQSPLSDERKAEAAHIFDHLGNVEVLPQEERVSLMNLLKEEMEENTDMMGEIEQVEKRIEDIVRVFDKK